MGDGEGDGKLEVGTDSGGEKSSGVVRKRRVSENRGNKNDGGGEK